MKGQSPEGEVSSLKAPKEWHSGALKGNKRIKYEDRVIDERKNGEMVEENECGLSSSSNAVYLDADGRSRTSSFESVKSNLSLNSSLAESAMSTPLSEYQTFQQPFRSVSFSCGGWLQFLSVWSGTGVPS